MKYLSLLLLALCLSGCSETKTPVQKAMNAQKDYLPTGASNVTSLDNGWFKFDLEIDGQNRTFLYRHVTSGYRGYECLTELQPR